MTPDPSPLRPANVVPLSTRQPPKPPAPQGLLADLAAGARKALEPAVKEAFGATDDDLFQRSSSNQELFDGLRELRLRQSVITRRFFEALEGGVSSITAPPAPGAPAPTPAPEGADLSLSLVDDGQLEESLAVSRLVATAEQAHAGELHALRQRFAVLAGGRSADDLELPIGPRAIAGAFQHALEGFDALTMDLRIVLYKHFERHANQALGAFFAEANQKLVDAGVLPNLRPQVARPASQGAPSGSLPADPAAQAGQPGVPGMPGMQGAPAMMPVGAGQSAASFPPPPPGGWPQAAQWAELQSLLSLRRQDGAAQSTDSTGAPLPSGHASWPVAQASAQDLSQAIAALRELHGVIGALGADAATLEPTQFKARLLQQLEKKAEGKGLGVHEDTIDAVGLLFEHVLKDTNLPASMQVLLSRLQLPFIKVAVLEPALFSQPHHPARQLLDALGDAAKSWSPEADKDRAIVGRIEQAVDTITRGFVDDHQVFAHELTAFRAFQEDAKPKREVVEKRTGEIAANRDRLEHAQAVVTQAMVERTAGKPLPEWARSMLLRDWTGHMVLIVRKDGHDSPAFRKALFFVEKVVEAPLIKGEASQKALATIVPALVRQMKDGLAAVGVAAPAIEATAASLQAYLQTHAGLRAAEPAAVATIQVIPRREPAPPKPQPDAKWVERVKGLAVGDWVEFRDETGRSTRGKVAWVSGFTGKLLFVTLSGARLGERLPDELAWLIQKGQAKPLENKPLFDRAVGSILDRLKK